MPVPTTSRKKSGAATKRRTVKKAAQNVQSGAERARELSAALIRAGELLAQGASFLDSMAERAQDAPLKKRSRRKK
jgi:hypothetical protein